jgi:acid phosphatase
MKFLIQKILLVSFLFFFSCAPGIKNIHFVKQELAEYYESGGFYKEVDEVINNAIKKFEAIQAGDSTAVIFDIDETALDNYEAIKEISFGYAPVLWDEWVEEARAPAIPAVKRLYDFLINKGIRIIFITGRKEHHYEATGKNLQSEGYTQFDTLIVRMQNEYGKKAVDFKSKKREELTARGYNIIGNVGDQWSDLEGLYSGIKIKIPDYLYIVE